MAKPTGFLEYARADAVKRPVPERLKDWHEIRLPHKQEEITRQAARCMNCGIPFCHSGVMLRGMASGCPVRNLIPEWNDLATASIWQPSVQLPSQGAGQLYGRLPYGGCCHQRAGV